MASLCRPWQPSLDMADFAFGSWPCDNAPVGCRRATTGGMRGIVTGLEHIFAISGWQATWFVVRPS
jgi:hypothetical protein